MNVTGYPEYQAILDFYAGRFAKRSARPYMAHITEGLKILDMLNSTLAARRAFCLHPIVQMDDDLLQAFRVGSVMSKYDIDTYPVALAMEYRSVANEFLSPVTNKKIIDIRLSPLKEVNDMLVADKIQNLKDLRIYNRNIDNYRELELYFSKWLKRLKISDQMFHLICSRFPDYNEYLKNKASL